LVWEASGREKNCWRESAGGRLLKGGKELLKEHCYKPKDWDFKKTKQRTCDSASLGAKTLREIKNSWEKT
jgi:hypothetical protein